MILRYHEPDLKVPPTLCNLALLLPGLDCRRTLCREMRPNFFMKRSLSICWAPHQFGTPPPSAAPALLPAAGRPSPCGAGPATDHQPALQPQARLRHRSQQPQLLHQFQLLLQHQLEVMHPNHHGSHRKALQMLTISFVFAGFSRMASISSIFRSHRRGTTPATPVPPVNHISGAGENPCKAASTLP